MKQVSLYFHIPFCTKKCPYCHFYVIPNRQFHQNLLAKSFELEIAQKLPLIQDKQVVSIYFGGGTPSLFQGIEQILKQLPLFPSCEITLEANPEELTLSRLQFFKSIGINRLSLGVQSLDDSTLQTLERTHSAKKAIQAIQDAKMAGFENVSIDLMYDLPNQTEKSWIYTLKQIEDLPIHHISLYNLTIEPHTSFHKRKVQNLPSELSTHLLNLAVKKFESLNLIRYEISAFALKGHESRHNLGYWTARPFLGFGPSAFSYWNEERFQNVCNINRYAKSLQENQSCVGFHEKLPYPENVKELLAVRLRTKEGADLKTFSLPKETHKTIEKLKTLQLLTQNEDQLTLTSKGILFYDTIAAEII